MTAVMINDRLPAGVRLLKYIRLNPDIAHIVGDDDMTPLPYSEDDLVSLEDFKMHIEELAQSRLGLNLKL
jgi:hypothetical protein